MMNIDINKFDSLSKEFFKSSIVFERSGLAPIETQQLLSSYIEMLKHTKDLAVLDCFNDESALEKNGVYTPKNIEINSFMLKFLKPILKNFEVKGLENLSYITPLLGKFPLVLISNHTSHLDTVVIYYLLHSQGGVAAKLADSLVFIASRLALENFFIRLGILTVDTLFVCSRRDMEVYSDRSEFMNKINVRSFRKAQMLQKDFRTIAIYPEGTRSRNGKLGQFVDSSYHFMANKIVIPISLEGAGEILPTEEVVFHDAHGKITIGRPVLCGELDSKIKQEVPDFVEHVKLPENTENVRRFWIDQLAKRVAGNLSPDLRGYYSSTV